MFRKSKTLLLFLLLLILSKISNRIVRNIDYYNYSSSYDEIDQLLVNEMTHSLQQVKQAGEARVNGVFLALVRNSELDGLKSTILQLESVLNQSYPYLLLNDEEFSGHFKEEIRKIVSNVEFGIVPKNHWSLPDWINYSKFKTRLSQLNGKVSYGGLESYRYMCRFNSGFFYKHPLLYKYDYYWRIEPNVDYYCKLRYDPFQVMKTLKKKYGYTVLAKEEMKTVNGLWEATHDFIKEKNITPGPLLKIFGQKEYNGLHFWYFYYNN